MHFLHRQFLHALVSFVTLGHIRDIYTHEHSRIAGTNEAAYQCMEHNAAQGSGLIFDDGS